MKRSLRITEDGSSTIYLSELDEPYHSIHGAVQESEHVFINHGFTQVKKTPIRILEIGFGTGLNALLTIRESINLGTEIHYHTVEKYPLTSSEFLGLNYESFLEGIPEGILQKMHLAPWGKNVNLTAGFTIHKEQADFREMNPKGRFDLIYFDAFSPDKQPELWSEDVFLKIADLANPGAVLVTYSSKGVVQRTLKSCGFNVKKVPGPPGKWEMIRAIRI
jgi:tRNA U34 5-methylaminomethyl-2-thiouridine-forming methyltransferase MnmC